MQEFILVIVVIFVLFRIMGSTRVVYHSNVSNKENTNRPPEGHVTINKIPANSAKNKPHHDSGDYVDYEEIK